MKEMTQSPPAGVQAAGSLAALAEAPELFAVPGPGGRFAPEEAARLARLYAANPLYADAAQRLIDDNPYRRPVDPQTVSRLDFSVPLARRDLLGSSALAAQRMLFNIYETDFVFLPERDFAAKREDFARFYSNENKLLGELLRPTLEAHLFGFLDAEVGVSGRWSAGALREYVRALVAEHEKSEIEILGAVLASADPERAARALMVQVAGDFLTESSSSARNLLGKFGQIQSELFKIALDDYGYGVHRAKHSTLFEETLKTCGLRTEAHAYWNFYLTGSLALNNYYHYVCRDHSKFFRAVGAVAAAESLFAHTCRKISETLRAVFGDGVDTYYFDEHYHIDEHHGRMATENVVMPAVERYGEAVIPEIVRGMEELQAVTALADEDFMAQLAWADAPEKHREAARELLGRGLDAESERTRTTARALRGEAFVTRVNDEHRLCRVEAGSLEVVAGHDQAVRLEEGEAVVIPRGRLHGLAARSEQCVYQTFELRGYEA